MSDVLRVIAMLPGDNGRCKLAHWTELPDGSSALMAWSDYERLRAVVDAALPYMCAGDDCTCDLCIAIRALDGEPCPTCGGCGYLMTDDPRKDEDCLTCHGSGKSWKYKPGTTKIEQEPCESCGGTGRKP